MADARLSVIVELVDKASAEFKRFSANVKTHEKDLKKVGMAAAGMGAAVVGAMALSVKSYMNAGDEVQKMAIRTGWTWKEYQNAPDDVVEAMFELLNAEAEVNKARLKDG